MILHALSMAFAMFWEILWALILGFALSGIVQAVVSKKQMTKLLGDDSPRSIAIACGLGAASSSCSYAAVALARSISDAIRKAEAEARRATAAKLEAAAKTKTKLALSQKKKIALKEPASSRAVRKLAALHSVAGRPRRSVHIALAKRLVHSRTKAAQRSRQVDET